MQDNRTENMCHASLCEYFQNSQGFLLTKKKWTEINGFADIVSLTVVLLFSFASFYLMPKCLCIHWYAQRFQVGTSTAFLRLLPWKDFYVSHCQVATTVTLLATWPSLCFLHNSLFSSAVGMMMVARKPLSRKDVENLE